MPRGVKVLDELEVLGDEEDEPCKAKKETATETLAAVKRGLRNSATSSIGWSLRLSWTMKRKNSAMPPLMVATAAAEPHPQSGASMTPKTRIAMAGGRQRQAPPVDTWRTRVPRGRDRDGDESRDRSRRRGP